jgi:hypothetical protein
MAPSTEVSWPLQTETRSRTFRRSSKDSVDTGRAYQDFTNSVKKQTGLERVDRGGG